MTKILLESQFGANLRRLREQSGLSQAAIVSKLHLLGSPLSRSTYSLIEMGRCNIFVSDLVGLQKVLDVAYSDFFEGIGTSRE